MVEQLKMIDIAPDTPPSRNKAGRPRVLGVGNMSGVTPSQRSKLKRIDYYRESDRQRGMARYNRRKPWFEKIKSEAVCGACGLSGHSESIDFHHVDSDTKKFCPSLTNLKRSRQSFLDELAKCAAVCAACHRRIHHGDLSGIDLETINVASLPPMPD